MAFEEKQPWRGGDGECAVFGFDGAAADVDAGAVDLGNVEGIECDAGADDVADGIDGADFVEVDFFDGNVVGFSFGFGEALKDCEGVGFGFGGELAGVDDFFDVREVAVLFLLGEIDAEFGGGDAFSFGFEEAERSVELEAL